MRCCTGRPRWSALCFRLSVLLVVALPARIGGRSSGWRRSFRKSVAILRWTIGQRTASIRKHDGLSPVDPRAVEAW